jgi:hypothetical protein
MSKNLIPLMSPLNPAGHLWINGQQPQDKYQQRYGTKMAENGQIVKNRQIAEN